MISGPMPSPRMTVIVWFIGGCPCKRRRARGAAWKLVQYEIMPESRGSPQSDQSHGARRGRPILARVDAGHGRSAAQQRFQPAVAVHRHHVVVAADVDLADE